MPFSVFSAGWPIGIALLVFLAAGLLVAGVAALADRAPNSMSQLKFYEQIRQDQGTNASDASLVDPESVRGRMVGVVGSVASRGGFDRAIRRELERAGLPLRPAEYMTLHVVGVLSAGLLSQLIFRNLLVTAVVVLLVALGPIIALGTLARKRRESFQAQLPEVLNLLAGSMRAGWGLLQAVGIVVKEMGAPAGPEFGRVVTEARLGLPLEEALARMAERVESEDFRWAVTAISIQREVGGNLAEVLDLVAETIRERSTLRGQIKSLTGEGRISAVILIALPFFEGGILWMLNPGYFIKLLSSPIGIGAATVAALLIVVGTVWLRRIVRIEV
jgi:tight adherence protein B